MMKRALSLVAILCSCQGTDKTPGSGADPSTATGGDSSLGTTSFGGESAVAGALGNGGTASVGGSSARATTAPSSNDGLPLGAYPVVGTATTRGGTMTFTNIGAAGWWPRRIDRPAGDPACTYKDGTDTWGGHCCMKEQATASTHLSPFDEEMTLILKAVNVRQLAVYQPAVDPSSSWNRVSAWDARTAQSQNLWFTQQGSGSTTFPGDLTKNDCVGYVMQQPLFDCGNGNDYYCPNDDGVLHQGYTGSKLVVLLANTDFSVANVAACSGAGVGQPAPWVAFVASELVRDGGRKWNGLCNCYSKTGTVGDGCGEINVFEVVMDNNAYSNREFASTGVRSYQAGHIGGAVASASLQPSAFGSDSDVVDACAQVAFTKGPVLVAGGNADGCPVWRRPSGDRYLFILLDEATRTIQVGLIHPGNIPAATRELLPEFPSSVTRATIDAIASLRLPS